MNANDLLGLLMQLLFILLGIVTILAFLSHRDQTRRDIALMFGALSVTFIIQVFTRVTGFSATWLSGLGTVALLAQPFLLLRLVRYFRPIPVRFMRFARYGMIGAWVLFIFLETAPKSVATISLLALIAYFAAVDGYAAVALVRSAFTTSGVVRQRLRFAAAGSGLLALALVGLGLAVLLPTLVQVFTVIVFTSAIGSALSYYTGFATPRWLRRTWQLSELRRYLLAFSSRPIGATFDADGALVELCRSATEAIGGVGAAVAQPGEREGEWVLRYITGFSQPLYGSQSRAGMLRRVRDEHKANAFRVSDALPDEDRRLLAAAGSDTVLIAPIAAAEQSWGLLLVFLKYNSLFIEDDLELITFLAQQNAIFMANSVLVNELHSYSEGLEHKIEERTRELANSRQEYRRIIDTAQEGIWVTDNENRTTFVNPRLSEMLGYTVEEIAELPVATFINQIGDDLVAAYRERRRQGVREQYDLQLRRKDGSVLDTLVSTTPLTDESGEYIGSLAMIADITERKRAEAEIRELNADLERRVAERTAQLSSVNRELEAFSYSVSHDLRSPLRALDGFSLALIEDYGSVLDSQGEYYLQRIRAGSQRMGELIDALLQLSRVSRTELQIKPVNLSELVCSIQRDLQELYPERQTEFQIQEGLFVNGDERLLRAALTNLVNNAWKFSGTQAHPRVEFGVAESKGRQAYFVRDNGVGFDMAYSNKLFGAFQRLHSAAEFEGTGIGLATVERILHRHGGEIWAESAVNQGATFYFTLS